MPRRIKTTICDKRAYRMISYLSDFNGGVPEWKDCFYQIWQWQITTGFAYSINVNESRKGVFIDILVSANQKMWAEDLLESMGYGNIDVTPESIGIVDSIDFPDDWFTDTIVVM